ncbi:MAG: peptidylprolyl isomerase, partial [Eudoraea sp.]
SPTLESDQRGGPPQYKILMVSNRFDEHQADFARDYIKIQELALRDKQYRAVKKWLEEHIKDTYVSITGENKQCEFTNDWQKN